MRQVAFTRFMFVIAVLVLWFGGVGARLVYLQISEHGWLRERAIKQRIDVKKSRLLRGTIYDRNGRALAMSVRSKTLYADATAIDDVAAASKAIAKALQVKQARIESTLKEAKDAERKFVPIAKELTEEDVQRINRLLEDPAVKKSDLPRFAGLHWREDQKRSYPQGTVGAHVIGFSNAEGVGQAGIEQSQNEALFGAVIKKVQERDRLGRVYDEVVSEQEAPGNIVLTIDASFQNTAEEALGRAVRESGAKSGMAIVIDHASGEVLAMANYPTFDPNDLKGISPENLRNNSIQSFYSPGSVFKLVTYGAALDRGMISPEAEIDTGNGTIEVAKHKFKDSRVLGRINFIKAMAVSSNVCAVKTGMRVGRENYYEAIKKFGFGAPTGIELPAETGGMVRSPEKWYGDSLASMSIGYEIGVSPLQMATAFATIANNGVRVQPRIIKEIRRSDETVISVTKPEKTRVVSDEAAAGLRRMLRQVVVSGTGKKAQVEGYSTAGKTGTAWKYDPAIKRVSSSKYVSSFIGYAPADAPKITIAVVIDEPRIGGRNGGDVAAPVFREITEKVLPELKVAPDSDGMQGVFETDEVAESVGNGESLGGPRVEDNIGDVKEAEKPTKTVEAVPAPAPKAETQPAAKPETKKVTGDRPRVVKPDAKTSTPARLIPKQTEATKEKPKKKT